MFCNPRAKPIKRRAPIQHMRSFLTGRFWRIADSRGPSVRQIYGFTAWSPMRSSACLCAKTARPIPSSEGSMRDRRKAHKILASDSGTLPFHTQRLTKTIAVQVTTLPDGQISGRAVHLPVQPLAQIFSAFPVGQIIAKTRAPCPGKRGVGHRHERWGGLWWTRQRRARDVFAGRFPVSEHDARDERR
jgi:hypothetical protein